MKETNNSSSVHDITDFAIAKEVVKDFPKLLSLLDKTILELYNYRHYKEISEILWNIDEHITFMRIHLEYYEKVKRTKAKRKT